MKAARILIATKNLGKFGEIVEMLGTLNGREGSRIEFCSLSEIGISDDFPEGENSFEENALAKARFYVKLSGLPTVADDSGIFVDALKGELGVKTRRFGAGEWASDEEWMAYFMKRMENEENRAARFVCAAAFAQVLDGTEESVVFLGETPGEITHEIEAPIQKGIPLSSVFKPLGYDFVYSALSTEKKNIVSHRGKAFKQLFQFLWTKLSTDSSSFWNK